MLNSSVEFISPSFSLHHDSSLSPFVLMLRLWYYAHSHSHTPFFKGTRRGEPLTFYVAWSPVSVHTNSRETFALFYRERENFIYWLAPQMSSLARAGHDLVIFHCLSRCILGCIPRFHSAIFYPEES